MKPKKVIDLTAVWMNLCIFGVLYALLGFRWAIGLVCLLQLTLYAFSR